MIHLEFPIHLLFVLKTNSLTSSASVLTIKISSALSVQPVKSSRTSVIKYRFVFITSIDHTSGPLSSHAFASLLIESIIPLSFKTIPSDIIRGNDGLARL